MFPRAGLLNLMDKKTKILLIPALLLALIGGCQARVNDQLVGGGNIWPKLDVEVKADSHIEVRIDEILSTMTLEQKVAQMIQPELRDFTVEDMRKYGFGSFLNGASGFPNNDRYATVQDWLDLAEKMHQASVDSSLDGIDIPTMWGTDAVHGHNNVVGATLFPHNIGLGATRNIPLIEKIAEVTAAEVLITGIDWVFSPTVAVVRDDRWGRTYEGYSEDPDLVRLYAAAFVKGLQGQAGGDFFAGQHVISTLKHFIGDGGTIDGDDQGNNKSNEQELFNIHAQGYVGGLTAGAQSVMASFSSWHGEKIHGSKYLITNVLKERMGFDGLVVGDWNGHGQIKGCSNEDCPEAVIAGLDILMVPTKAWKPLLENTINQVELGIIPLERIDDAVSRILRVKLRAGLFDKASPANRVLAGSVDRFGSENHRQVARQAVRESLVLLKNNGNLLPLSPNFNILVAGDGADNIGKQSGGWSISWQGTDNKNSDFPGGSSIYEGFAQQVKAAGGHIELNIEGEFSRKPDVAIVVFGEDPYAEGHGDLSDLAYSKDEQTDLALLKSLKEQGIPVVSIFLSGRPLWVNAELNASDAFVAAWLPGSEGQAVAEVLLRDKQDKVQHNFSGKLSFSWPSSPLQLVNKTDRDYRPLFPYGFGLRYGDLVHLPSDLPEEFGLGSVDKKGISIFEGKPHKLLKMFLTSGKKDVAIHANTQVSTGIHYRTIDKMVQEDAFRVKFFGQESSGVKFVSIAGREKEMATLASNSSSISLTVKTGSAISDPVWVVVKCPATITDSNSCYTAYDIADELRSLPPGIWQQISINLSCFSKYSNSRVKGSAVSLFELHAAEELDLSISNIQLYQTAKTNSTQCNSVMNDTVTDF